jgi:hypothetical protein
MNWDAIGAIAETLGAVGVIASLVYLATQIRHSREQMSQNTRASEAGAHQLNEQSVSSAILEGVRIPGVGRILVRGWQDFEELGDEDAFVFNCMTLVSMRTWDNAHYQHRMGMLDDVRWQAAQRDLETFVRQPGVIQWWQTTQPNLLPEFVALVEEILAEEPDRGE